MCCESFFPFAVDVALKLSASSVASAEVDPAFGRRSSAEPRSVPPLLWNATPLTAAPSDQPIEAAAQT